MADTKTYCKNCFEPTTQRCSGCSKVYFCSENCQKKLWPLHIFDCNPTKPPNTAYHLTRAVYLDMIPTHPQTCIDYGFARCKTEEECSNLISLYQGLIKILEIDPMVFHHARRKGRLVAEIRKHYEAHPESHRGVYYPWFLQNLHLLDQSTHPSTSNEPTPSSHGNASVEDLVQFLRNPKGDIIPSVGVDYGFWNCKTPAEKVQLVATYKRYFQHPDSQMYALHNACIEGKTFEHISSIISMSSEESKLAKRLMKNPYPLLEAD